MALSVLWIDGFLDPEIWKIGDDVACGPRGKDSLARAEFLAEVASEVKLTIESDPAPHPRHVLLRGWPSEKDKQKEIALELCSRSKLHVRPAAGSL
jgi:hypothetical protein